MALPLLTRATPDGLTLALTRRTVPTAAALLVADAPVAVPPKPRSGLFAVCLGFVAMLPPVSVVVALLFVGMGLLGMGNGAVFQMVPQRFPDRIGVVTGVVGAAGGLGGFFLPTLLGAMRDMTGTYATGLAALAVMFVAGTLVLLELGARWSARWSEAACRQAGVYSYKRLPFVVSAFRRTGESG